MSENQDSFEKLVEEYTPMIHKIIHSLHIYKDFNQYHQLGLIALWETTGNFDEKQGKFSSLAYSTIRGRILDQLKIEARYSQNFLLSNSSIDFVTIDESSELPFEYETLLSYCEGLSEKQIRWVKATFLEHKNMSELAREEGVSKIAILKWKELALRHIKKNIETNNDKHS